MPPPGQKYVLRIALPLRARAQRFGFVVLLALAFALMVFGRTEMTVVEQFRTSISDMFVPVLSALSHPVGSVRGVASAINNLTAVHQENVQLREANARLQRWEVVAHKLERENAALKDLLSYRPGPLASFISARVVGGSGSAYVRALLLNAGSRDGVEKGHAVINGTGMVGRVVEVGQRSARVLLLTDLNSRIPIVVGTTGDRAILAGDNSDILYLDLLSPKADIDLGMRVTTSGHGGKLPSGLPIGRVSAVHEGGVKVQPFVDFDRLEYVMVADWTKPVFEPVSASKDKVVGGPLGKGEESQHVSEGSPP